MLVCSIDSPPLFIETSRYFVCFGFETGDGHVSLPAYGGCVQPRLCPLVCFHVTIP